VRVVHVDKKSKLLRGCSLQSHGWSVKSCSPSLNVIWA